MIAELLNTGQENAITGRRLAEMLGADIRVVTAMIQQERRNGAPICASNSAYNPGFYLAKNAAEIKEQADRMHKRAGELYKTRRALLKVLEKIQQIETE